MKYVITHVLNVSALIMICVCFAQKLEANYQITPLSTMSVLVH